MEFAGSGMTLECFLHAILFLYLLQSWTISSQAITVEGGFNPSRRRAQL